MRKKVPSSSPKNIDKVGMIRSFLLFVSAVRPFQRIPHPCCGQPMPAIHAHFATSPRCCQNPLPAAIGPGVLMGTGRRGCTPCLVDGSREECGAGPWGCTPSRKGCARGGAIRQKIARGIAENPQWVPCFQTISCPMDAHGNAQCSRGGARLGTRGKRGVGVAQSGSYPSGCGREVDGTRRGGFDKGGWGVVGNKSCKESANP